MLSLKMQEFSRSTGILYSDSTIELYKKSL